MSGFRNELQQLINKHSMENGSNTPDFLLADYLNHCVAVFDATVKARDKWYGITLYPGKSPEQIETFLKKKGSQDGS